MNNKVRTIAILLMVLSVACAAIGSTLAYWIWQTTTNERTTISLTVGSGFSCSADGGGNITSNDKVLAPAACTNSTYAIKRTVTVGSSITQSGINVYLDLWLKVNSIDTGLRNSNNFKYALTTSSSNCTTGVVANGSFNGATANSTKMLLHNKEYLQTGTDTYYLWIWLDAAETSSSTQNQNFDIELGGSCTNQAPTTFTGTIYRYSTESISIGDSIAPTVVNRWCDVEDETGNVFDCFDTENECNQFLQDEGYTETDTCTYGVTKPVLTSYETNVSNINSNFYLKHTVYDDIITESYVGFVVTSAMATANPGMVAGTYYLKGGDNGASFLDNAKTIYDAFGGVGCYLDGNSGGNPYTTTPSSDFGCSVSGLYANANSNGFVNSYVDAGAYCDVNNDGYSNCYE